MLVRLSGTMTGNGRDRRCHQDQVFVEMDEEVDVEPENC